MPINNKNMYNIIVIALRGDKLKYDHTHTNIYPGRGCAATRAEAFFRGAGPFATGAAARSRCHA